jgi:hypothetical protein
MLSSFKSKVLCINSPFAKYSISIEYKTSYGLIKEIIHIQSIEFGVLLTERWTSQYFFHSATR